MTVIDLSNYTLVWSDEFEGEVLDSTKWIHQYPNYQRKIGYNKVDAITVNNGSLKNTVYKNELDQYCSGFIATKGKFEQKYGYFEASIKLPNIYGLQPAFWLMSDGMGTLIGDPSSAGCEIDIIEYVKTSPNIANHTVHWDGYGVDHKSSFVKTNFQNIADGNFHTFGVLWDSGGYKIYIDRKFTGHIQTPVSNVNQYMIISCEIGTWGGDITIDEHLLPAVMEVEYVRVYQI